MSGVQQIYDGVMVNFRVMLPHSPESRRLACQFLFSNLWQWKFALKIRFSIARYGVIWRKPSLSLFFDRSDIAFRHDNIVKPDGCGLDVDFEVGVIDGILFALAKGSLSDVMQQPEEIDLQFVVRAPTESLERFAALFQQCESHTCPGSTRCAVDKVSLKFPIQPQG